MANPIITVTCDEVLYMCTPAEPVQDVWDFPVGNFEYPPEKWYAASYHVPSSHSGLDLNIDIPPWGDTERVLGLKVYAVTDMLITYMTSNWSGNPMLVGKKVGEDLYIRYAHIIPMVELGDTVEAGDVLGLFADWETGDHLHFDMATDYFEREYLTPGINWIDPVPILKQHLGEEEVKAMLRRGD